MAKSIMVVLNPSSDSRVLTVQEAVESTRISLVLNPATTTPSQPVVATAYLETLLSVPVGGVTVRLEDQVGLPLGTAITDVFGNASIPFTSPASAGAYTYTIFFDGVSGYAASQARSDLRIAELMLPDVASIALAAAPVIAVIALIVADSAKRMRFKMPKKLF